MCRTTTFDGPMRHQILEFMRFRKSLGFAQRNTAYVFAEFDRYLKKKHPKARVITRPMVTGYLSTTVHLHSTSRGYRVTLLRGLCRYLYQKNPAHYVPEARLVPGGKRKLKPHVYTDAEIRRILAKLRNSLVPKAYLTAVSLLFATGIRAGELERLNIEDVDLEAGVLSIQRSKFYKSRLVPVSTSTRRALLIYRELRLESFPTVDCKAAFFVGFTGLRLRAQMTSRIFRRAVRSLGLKTACGTWPRLHDLRHTFATRAMHAVYASGNDPSAHLPVLATYMGHVNLDHTQTYLHPSIELLAKAGTKFKAFSGATES